MSGELLAKCGCVHCGTHLEFPIEAAGTVISCPHCGGSTELTLERPLDAGNRVPVGELVGAFNGSIRSPRVSIFYQFGLVLATAVMVLLPVLYLAMIVALHTASIGMRRISPSCSSSITAFGYM